MEPCNCFSCKGDIVFHVEVAIEIDIGDSTHDCTNVSFDNVAMQVIPEAQAPRDNPELQGKWVRLDILRPNHHIHR